MRPGEWGLGTRLAVVVGVAVLVVLAITAFVLVRVVRTELAQRLERDLEVDLVTVIEDLRDEGDLEPSELEDDLAPTTGQILSGDGRVLAATGTFVGIPSVLDLEVLRGVTAGARAEGTTTVAGSEYRVAAGGVPGTDVTVVVAREVAAITAPQQVLGRVLLPVGLVAGAVVAAVAAVILQRGLAPLRAMATTAETIEGRRADERLPEPPAGRSDEVARLATTINALLERIDAARERERAFTADAGHELRTPLAIMRARLELTRDRVTGRDRSDLDVTLEEIDRLAGLVDDLLALARADAERRDADTDVDLGDIARQTAARFAELAAGHGVQVRATGTARCRGDRRGLERVLTNLVDNAVRHAGTSVLIHLRTRAGRGIVEVIDDGPGVADADLDDLFVRYRQADDGTPGGAGLGLAIVAAVATAHGGSVHARNRDPTGLVVTITLPATDEAADPRPRDLPRTTTPPAR